MHMHTHEASTYIALVWEAQASSHLPMHLILFVTFFPFSLKVVLFMVIVGGFFAASSSLPWTSLHIQTLVAAAAHSLLELCYCALASVY